LKIWEVLEPIAAPSIVSLRLDRGTRAQGKRRSFLPIAWNLVAPIYLSGLSQIDRVPFFAIFPFLLDLEFC
jgi:hypothetical protein